MILSEHELRTNADELVVPFNPWNVASVGIDLTLAADPAARFKSGELTLDPNESIELSTVETIKVPEYLAAFVEGVNSFVSLGLFVSGAGFIASGVKSPAHLIATNFSSRPAVLKAGQKICRVVYMQLNHPVNKQR